MCMCVCVCVRARLRAVLKRKKSVYGLKTSVHHFIQQLAEKILSFPVSGTCPKTGRSESYGFKRVPIDHCFFRYEDGEGNIMFLLHYVDDLMVATTSLKIRSVFLAHVKNGRRLQRASCIGIWGSTISGMSMLAREQPPRVHTLKESYSSVPGHRNWQIEIAAWIGAVSSTVV